MKIASEVSIKRIGGSLALLLPAKLTRNIGFEEGQPVEITLDDDVLVVKKLLTRRRPKLNIKDLLAQCDLAAINNPDNVDTAWLESSAQGNELL